MVISHAGFVNSYLIRRLKKLVAFKRSYFLLMLVMWGGRGNGVDLLISMYKKLILTGMLKKPLAIRTSCNFEEMLLVS